MGLVGVTEIVGQRRWVGLGLTRQSIRSLLEAIPPDHPLRAYAYVLGEEPLELTRSYAVIASKLINASDVRSGCDVIDDLRNCLSNWVALGPDAAQESVRLRDHLALVGRVEHGAPRSTGPVTENLLDTKEPVGDRGHRCSEERAEASGPEPDAQNSARAVEHLSEPRPHHAIHSATVLLEHEVDRRVGQDMLGV